MRKERLQKRGKHKKMAYLDNQSEGKLLRKTFVAADKALGRGGPGNAGREREWLERGEVRKKRSRKEQCMRGRVEAGQVSLSYYRNVRLHKLYDSPLTTLFTALLFLVHHRRQLIGLKSCENSPLTAAPLQKNSVQRVQSGSEGEAA